MQAKTYSTILESLPHTEDRDELIQYDRLEILDDIMDFMEIRFPNWKEELESWAAEFILTRIKLNEDCYYDTEAENYDYLRYLINLYEDINDSYNTTKIGYQKIIAYARLHRQ